MRSRIGVPTPTGSLLMTMALGWPIDVCRSLILLVVISRLGTKMARSRSFSMVRSTTIKSYAVGLRARGTSFGLIPIRKRSSTFTKNLVATWSMNFVACSPLHCGTATSGCCCWLATDFGQKPLYYSFDGERLLFGSEIKAILAYGGVRREVDPQALEDYLAFGFVPGRRSIFTSVRKLEPASTLLIDAEKWSKSEARYWQLQGDVDHNRSVEEWQEAVAAKFTESVSAHRIADVPIGAFLSGGLDSSAVTAVLAGLGTRTCSARFRSAFKNAASVNSITPASWPIGSVHSTSKRSSPPMRSSRLPR